MAVGRAAKGWGAAALVAGMLIVATPDVAAAAVGGTVEVPVDGNFFFEGAAGFANSVTVTKTGTTLTLDDVHSVAIIAGSPCTYPNPADDTFVQCTVGASTPDVHVEPGDMGDTVIIVGGDSVHWLLGVGDGNDVVDLTGVDVGGAHVVGGNGDDRVISSTFGEPIEGNAGNDTVSYAGRAAAVVVNLASDLGGSAGENDSLVGIERAVGGNGNDTLTGDSGVNILEGGPGGDALWGAGGDDTLVGGTGTDEIHGGAGSDQASYLGHPTAVTASLNGLADDGSPGENDLIASDVENLAGSIHSDTLSGNIGANALYGDTYPPRTLAINGGDDVITTNGGGDGVWGGGGDDTVNGGSGHDVVHGGYGDDVVHGGSHEDGLYGEAGADSLFGDGGYDILDGGPDNDWCDAGAEGASKANCELPVIIWP